MSSQADRLILLAWAEVNECLKDMMFAMLLPNSNHRVSKISGCAAGIRRALERIEKSASMAEPAGSTSSEPKEKLTFIPQGEVVTTPARPPEPTGTITGRLTHDIQAKNLYEAPPASPDPQSSILSADFSGIEERIIAHTLVTEPEKLTPIIEAPYAAPASDPYPSMEF